MLQTRFAAASSRRTLWSGRYDLVLLSGTAYSRFLEPENRRQERQRIYAERCRERLAMPELQAFESGRSGLGPGCWLRRLERPSTALRTSRDFTTADAAYVSDESVRQQGGAPVAFTEAGQFVLFKEFFAAGRYVAAVDGDSLAGGVLQAVGLDGTVLGEASLPVTGNAEISLQGSGRVFFYLKLLPGATLRGLRIHASS